MSPSALRPLPLSVGQILAWADEYHRRTGRWPRANSGPIRDRPRESWGRVDRALRKGSRGLPGGTSLARLLAQQRGARNSRCLPPLAEEEIAGWARSYRQRTGRWPARRREDIVEAPGETWCGIDNALRQGTRGLPGGSSLPNLLRQRLGAHCRTRPTRLTVAQILAWADAHHARYGRWPHAMTGVIGEAPGATWRAVDLALRQGHRGLPGGDSLSRLLDEHRRGPRPDG